MLKKYILAFGNIFLLLQESQLEALGRMLELQYIIFYYENPIGNRKQISLNTPLHSMYLAFSSNDFNSFTSMVSKTNLVLEAREILNNTYRKSRKQANKYFLKHNYVKNKYNLKLINFFYLK